MVQNKTTILTAVFLCGISLYLGLQESKIIKNSLSKDNREVLFKGNETIHSLKAERSKLLQQIDNLQNELKQNQQPSFKNTNTEEENVEMSSERELTDICHPLPPVLPPATTTWRNYLKDIIKHSLIVIPGIKWKNFESWFELLLDHLTPVHLLKSVKTLPNMKQFRRVVQILQARYKYLNDKGTVEGGPPPLKILVFGGSITQGVVCRMQPFGYKFTATQKKCSWTFRLEQLINKLLGYEAVKILNDASGGTNSELGATRINYNLLPDLMPDPDIIINAYSSNDMHVLTMADADAKNLTLSEAVFDLTQTFIRTVEGSRHCDDDHRPLLIYFDDYLGNEQHGILDTMAFSSSLQTLANYYDIMSISYADAVRQIVYADTRESWFSSDWYDNEANFIRQIHPGLGVHVSMMYVIAFNLLNALTIFCNEEAAYVRREPFVKPIKYADEFNNYYGEERVYMYRGEEGVPGVDRFNELLKWPAPIPHGIIPELNSKLKIQDVSSLWKRSSERYMSTCGTRQKDEKEINSPCRFSWIAQVNEITTVEALDSKMNEIVIANDGWSAQDDHNKLGYVPTDVLGSNFVMELKNIAQPLKTINFVSMKSFGELWKDSRILITVFKGEDKEIKKMEIEGFHASETSVSYQHTIELNETDVGDDIRVSVKLIGGSTFKIMGVSFCYR